MAEQSLRDKTVKGVAWSGIDNVTQYGMSFVVSIVLARLLSPDDYGLIGIIAIFTAVCNTLIYAGFGTALIRKKNVTDEDYNTVFLTNLITSLLLYAVIFLCSPLIAEFFQRDELVALTRVSAFGIIIGALAIVQQTILTKQINFKTQTKITIIASVLSGAVGISMALCRYGVWALVFQGLVSGIVRTSLLWIYNRWIPTFHFSNNSFCELFGYGWKLTVSGLLDSIWKQMYQVVVGKFYSPTALGQYTRATGFSELFSNNLTNVIQRVTFPVLSNIQDEQERMVLAYRKIIKISMFISSVSMFTLGAVSEPLLYCLIGPQWKEAAVYLPLICISASTYPLHALNLNMLEVQGRSDLFLLLEIIKKVIYIFPLFIGALCGIIPMLYINLFATIICYFLNSYYPGKILGYTSLMQFRDIAPSFFVASVVSVSIYFLKYLPLSYWFILPLQGMTGAFLFIVVCKITNNKEFIEVLQTLSVGAKRFF